MTSKTNQTETKQFGTKEYLREKLEGIDTIYVVYLNENGTRMMLYYVDKEDGKLSKVWINPEINENVPSYWAKGTAKDVYKYCFRVTGYGTSLALEAVHSLWNWVGIGVKYGPSNLPDIENLN